MTATILFPRYKIALLSVCACLLMAAVTAFGQKAGSMKWSNRLLEFNFDADQGTYTITDMRDGKVCVENAFFQINDDVSTGGYIFTTAQKDINDEMGKGKKLTIEGTKSGRNNLLLEATIYNGQGFVVLNTGIKNTGSSSLRITKFYPLKGTAYKGFALDDYKTLDGESGAEFTKVATADSARSNNNLLVTFGKKGGPKRSLVAGGLTYNEFRKYVSVARQANGLSIELKGDDPVGKLVDAGTTYMLKDAFYVDCLTDNRFEALEKYGKALATANHAEVGGVTIPILNFWYCFVTKFGGDQFRDNSTGTVEEMEEVAKTGFLKYSPVGIRLEPDDYALPNNEQGWWDDKHWQMYKGGQLLPPYETIEKWGGKIQAMGGMPFIYCQTAKRSQDYCLQYPQQMLFNNPYSKRSGGPIGWWGKSGDTTAIYWTYDFTDAGFIRHMEDVYRNLKKGGVQGIKFDYPNTGWSYDGGFDDKYATTTSAYRTIFRLAYKGLGPNRDVQERIPPYGDVALGVITTQRTEGDNDRVYPGRVAKVGLRWYKNRVVTNYDCDPINPGHVYPSNTRDGWQAAITMTYTTSGRMEIGKYFEKMTPEMLFDLSRAVPLLPSPTASARPADAFSGKPYPEVYDFTIRPDWHIITFFNQHIEGETWPTDVMAYWEENKQFIPKKMISATINIPLGDKTDDGGLALAKDSSYYVFDFWNWKYIGKMRGSETLSQSLRPGEARVMAVHKAAVVPQFLSTSRHLLQGYLDMAKYPEWNSKANTLAGTSKVIAGEPYKIIIAANGYKAPQCTAANATCETKVVDATAAIYEVSITSAATADLAWKMRFEK